MERRGAGSEHGGAGGLGAVEAQLDFALERCGHGIGLFKRPVAQITTERRLAPETPLRTRAFAEASRTNIVHREALEGEGREAEIAGSGISNIFTCSMIGTV